MNRNNRNNKVKWIFLLVCCVVTMIFIALFLHGKEETEHISVVDKRECVICKELSGKHSGENNLGIINLHDGTAYYIRINKYDRLGNENTAKDEYFQLSNSASLRTEMTISIETDADRGYANVDIVLGDETKMDYEKAAKTCCQECLDAALQRKEIDKQQFGIAVINYKNGEVKVLSENLKAFMNEDYYVNCEVRKSKMGLKIEKVELLVFYCPVIG